MYKRIYLLIIAVVGTWMFTACQKDRTILPDLGILATNDLNDAGGGSFTYVYEPLNSRPIKVWFYTPRDAPKDVPILFIMHGVERNGQTYRNNWVNLARENNWLIIAPEYSTAAYPGSRYYNVGNVFSGSGGTSGTLNPEDQWTFSTIEAIFDHVVAEIGGTQQTYNIYGHSAGSQFVSRMVTLKSEPMRLNRAIFANAGWYTLLDVGTAYPYGISNLGLTDEQINRALAQDVVILLGEADVNVDDNLNTDPPAMAQGPHRFARGHYYFNYHKELAASRGVSFGWKLATVPGAGHSNRSMAPSAANFLK
ncbi:alpha/beta hydrolase [Parapedobacter sp. SGR-10]|uniref:alpha/beta hydrolase n=1 Tax=Parapedobacter sp. SGR-10 TaxID=2710879 RepID=UPI0013D2F32D|nr:alpha/beta hydrolase [Parapedobacter sp. SGR-10]NGF56841.1 alpha/beta hydrolase [Parapedobacter sp. SGR-10]